MAMFHNFNEVCHQKYICIKETPVIIYGKRSGGRSEGCFGTNSKPAGRYDTEVTNTSNNSDDIVTTFFSRQHAAKGRSGAGSKAQDKYGVRKVGLFLSPSLLLDSITFFHSLKKARPKKKSFSNEGSLCRRLRKRE